MSDDEYKVSSFSQALLWFGAAVAITEIAAGALLAPIGFQKGLLAVLIGHAIGAAVLLPGGMIGARSGLSAARSARISFGRYGSFGFSILNILQLIGWTAIMIITGAMALDAITASVWGYQNEKLWCVLIGLVICLWVVIGIKNLSKVNVVAVIALFAFTLILGVTVFREAGNAVSAGGTMSFGSAVELNVVMSISWLPLISDYTRKLENPKRGVIASVAGYTAGSLLMYLIGLGAAVYAGTSDVIQIMLAAGLSAAAFLTVLFSTVTTTFLDVYSAGVNAANFSGRINEKAAAIAVGVLGIALSLLVPMSQYENFLYFIGSVFAPLFSILFVDFFVFGKTSVDEGVLFDWKNIALWAAGFLAYRLLMSYDTVIGITAPVMFGVGLFSFAVNSLVRKRNLSGVR
jgi:putative hydroxymethylpyrimidine transporter CytX